MEHSKIGDMACLLKDMYDVISKADAAKFLKQHYPDLKLNDFRKAYELAYC